MKVLKEIIALKDNGTSSIANAVIEAYTKGATKILFDRKKQYILYQRPLKEDELEVSEQREIYRIARINEIIDFEKDKNSSIKEDIFDMFSILIARKLRPSFVLVRSIKPLARLMGQPYSLPNLIMGAKLYEYEEIEEDIILVCGTEIENAESYDIVLSVKGYI